VKDASPKDDTVKIEMAHDKKSESTQAVAAKS